MKFCHISRWIIVLFICTFMLFSNILTVNASDARTSFSVRIVPNEKQINKSVSYFDLLLEPGESHEVEVEIFSNDTEPIEVLVSVCTACTNTGGVIDYDKVGVTDDSMIISLEEIAEISSPSVIIPPGEKRIVSIKLEVPEFSFDGIMLGGISVRKKIPVVETTGNMTAIQNEYCYIIGLKTRFNETKVYPDLKLHGVGPTLVNSRTGIAATLQNFNAALIKGMSVDAKIYFNNQATPMYSSYTENFDAAPNSTFDYLITCPGRLAPGYYRLELTAILEDRQWDFEHVFNISAPEAAVINEQAVNVPQMNYYQIATFVLIGVLLLVILTLLILWFIKRRKKSDEVSGA